MPSFIFGNSSLKSSSFIDELSSMKDNTSIKDDDFNELFPKINDGILNLKTWLKSEFSS